MTKNTREKGSGHIFKRGNVYYFQYTVNGKRIVQSLKTKDFTIAQKRAKDKLGLASEVKSKEITLLKIAEARNLISAPKIKVCDIWKVYEKSMSRPDSSKRTLKVYEGISKKFIKWLNDKYPHIELFSQVTEEVAISFADYLWNEEKISERTFNLNLFVMQLIFRVLCRDIRNPFSRDVITRKTVKPQGHKKFTEEQLMTLLNTFKKDMNIFDKEEMEILFYIGALTGLRLIDCCLMKWDSISFKDELIRVIPQKTRRIRRMAVIPISRKLHEKLKVAESWRVNDFVLPKIAKRYSASSYRISREAGKVIQLAGFEGEQPTEYQRKQKLCIYGFHSLRHTYASIMASNGYSINMLSKILADNTKTLEQYYINIDDTAIKNTFNRLLLPESFGDQHSDTEELKSKIFKIVNNCTSDNELKLIYQHIQKLKTS